MKIRSEYPYHLLLTFIGLLALNTLNAQQKAINANGAKVDLNFVDKTNDESIDGNKTFTSDLKINGISAGLGNSNVSSNTVFGTSSLGANTSGYYNAAFGYQALQQNTSGMTNTAIGTLSLNKNTSGYDNTAIGAVSNTNNTSGRYNTAIGRESLVLNTTGNANTALGLETLYSNTTGGYNTGAGVDALVSNTTGSNNVGVGYGADVASGNLSNAIAIGYGAIVANNNSIKLGNGSITNVQTAGTLTAGSITYPNTAGTSGYVLTTDGSNTATWAAAPGGSITHTIGESYGGGKVFYVTTDGLHGLIAETQDQSNACTWYDAQDRISTSSTHSTAGKLFTDWRLPTRNELNLLYAKKAFFTGFQTYVYWCSTEVSGTIAWLVDFGDGSEVNWFGKGAGYNVRSVRSF